MSEKQEIATQTRSSDFIFFWPFASGQMIDYIVEMQKFNLDLYARQTTMYMDFFRRMFPMLPAGLLESAQKGLAELFRTQMQALDSIANRGKEYLEDRGGQSGSGNFERIVGLLTETANQFAAIHRKLVEILMQQIQSFSTSILPAHAGSGIPVMFGGDVIQRNTEMMMDAQRRFWGMFLRT